MQVPDAIEPAVGYRVWLVKYNRLYSFAFKDSVWVPEEAYEAKCDLNREHVPPVKGCRCGLYAAATFNRLFDLGYTKESGSGLLSVHKGEVTIAGEVKLWGKIIPGSEGWRAQFAYPKKLLVPYSRAKIARQLSETYNVPFKLYNLERKH